MKRALYILLLLSATITRAQITVTLNNITYTVKGELTCTYLDTVRKDKKTEYYLKIANDSVHYTLLVSSDKVYAIDKYNIAVSDLGVSKKNWFPPKIEVVRDRNGTSTKFYDLFIKTTHPNKKIQHDEIWEGQQNIKSEEATLHLIFDDKSKAEAALEKIRQLAKKKK